MNIAFEISPLLLASGSFGDKSGVYRYLTGLISSIEKINEMKGQKIILFSFNRNLLLSQVNPCLYELVNNKNFVYLNNFIVATEEPVVGSFIKKKIFKIIGLKIIFKIFNKIFGINSFYNYLREKIHEKNYLEFLKTEFKKNSVTHIVHSNTSFKNIDGFKNIQIIYDLTPTLFPFNHRNETLDLFRSQIEFAKNHCQGIISISKSTKKDLFKYYPVFKNKKLKIIYPGCDDNLDNETYSDSYKEISQAMKIKDQQLVKNNYLIYFGTFEPRKNIIYLVKSFVDLQKEKAIPSDFKLVLIGGEGWGNIKCMIRNYVDEEFPLASKRNVIILDFLADRFLYSLVKNAYATVYPSLYEGFGLPVLESMKLGTPIISSDNSSIPEVGGDAILYSKVNNYFDLKNKIKVLINDQELAKDFSKKGLIQSQKFNWKKSGQQFYDFLKYL
ncbi:MAG: glycosyltransferase family 1 protein [Patescibacteria group bacterium]|jgi:glycosyltransferase involved in cell wall biosynthesis